MAVAVFAATGACTLSSQAVRVGFVFGDDWTLGPVALTADEQARIKGEAFKTLRDAFAGFNVDFAEDPGCDRIIRLNRYLFGSGSTQVGSKVSAVNLDGVHLTLLAVTGCRSIDSCEAYPRAVLVDALGRGIGATAAHELGHQAGFEFTRELNCGDCYDGVTSETRAHFFGEKHWSTQALAAMHVVLRSRP
jgi:hypothetical protein